jgi:carbon storage regulator CsrA
VFLGVSAFRLTFSSFGTASAFVVSRVKRKPHQGKKESAVLVLTRKANQQIQIGNNIVITILQVKGQQVRVGIEAPRDLRVMRAELGELPGLEQTTIVPETKSVPGTEPAGKRVNRLPGDQPAHGKRAGNQSGPTNRISSIDSSQGSAGDRARTLGDHVSRLMRRRTPDAVNSAVI